MSSPGVYPDHRVADVVLRDGSTVRIRPVRPNDAQAVMEMFERMSPESRSFRFHASRKLSPTDIQTFVDVDYRDRFGLLVETAAAGAARRTIGLANYVRTAPHKAEMAIAVDDAYQSKGVGSLLLEHLSEAAAEADIPLFEAEVMTANRQMLEVLSDTRLPSERNISWGSVHVEFPTSLTEEAIAAFERREAIAAAAGVRSFLNPRSIAVIGASRRRGTIGGEIFRNLIQASFNGPVYPVNPTAEVVQSVRAYATVEEIPGPVDLAVIVVPAPIVADVARRCGRKGVKALLVISSGFGEVGDAGIERQEELLGVARDFGMRIIGPNCMGVMNLDPEISLNATFAPQAPPPGRLAFSSQSGALGIAIIDRARELGLGMSTFVSVGNKADISGNDLLQYWEGDENTDIALLYLESFGNPRRFARIARKIARSKPIVAVKSGRSEAGVRAAASHTGSLAAGDVAVDALFRQAGVIRTDTLEELFDVAVLLSSQPLPAGDRVAILTNAGGLGILCADACETAGLSVPVLSDETTERLRALLAAEASAANPVDMIASATAEQYAQALEILAEDTGIDSIIVIFIEPLVTRAEDVAIAVARSASKIDKTMLTCFLGAHGIHELFSREGASIPSYAFPESAARSLGRVTRYARWRTSPEGSLPRFEDIHLEEVRSRALDLLHGGERWLEAQHVSDLLQSYGIRHARTLVAPDPAAVRDAASEIGRPVVVKIDSRTIVHKSDVGGVRLNLGDADAAAKAAEDIVRDLGRRGLADQLDGFVVQEMVSEQGAEMYVGVTHDPSFGPLIACGAGGVLLELVRDVSVRITPLTDLDAHEMLTSLKTWPVLDGYRGMPALDHLALEELLLRVSVMVEDLPHLAELDLNPVLVLPAGDGCIALDARIRIAQPEPARPRGARTATPGYLLSGSGNTDPPAGADRP